MITTTTETVEVTIVSPEGGKIAEAVSPREAYSIMCQQIREYGHNPGMIKIGEQVRPGYRLEAILDQWRRSSRKMVQPIFLDHHVTDDPAAWMAKIMLWAIEEETYDFLRITSIVEKTKVPYVWGLLISRDIQSLGGDKERTESVRSN